MRKLSCLIALFIITMNAHAQTCLYTDLSKAFDFETEITHSKGVHNDSLIITARISDKQDKNNFQIIRYGTTGIIIPVLYTCGSVRSYSTKINLHKEVDDNNYGDLIVADFNFDSKDDIALVVGNGGIGGYVYNFYIQDENAVFKKDSFLSDTMLYFPGSINKNTNSLTTIVPINYYGVRQTTYTYNTNTKAWIIKQTKNRDIRGIRTK